MGNNGSPTQSRKVITASAFVVLIVTRQISGSFERSHNTHSIDTFLTDVIFTNSPFLSQKGQQFNFKQSFGQTV